MTLTMTKGHTPAPGALASLNIRERRSTLRDLVYVLFRRKWVIVGVILSTLIPVTFYTLRIPPTYEAKSTVLIKPGRENIYVAPVGAPEGALPPTVVQRVAEIINSEIEIIRTNVLIREVLEKIGVDRVFPDMTSKSVSARTDESEKTRVLESAAGRALKDLSVDRVKDTDVIEVRFRSRDPSTSADFVNALVDKFLDRHLEVYQSAPSYEFFRAQSNLLQQRLESVARNLSDFRKKYGIVSFDQLKQLTLENYSAVNAQKLENEAQIKQARKRVERLRGELSQISEHTYTGQSENTEPAVVIGLRQKLVDLELEKSELLYKYKPNDFRIASIDDRIAKVSEALDREQEQFHGLVTTGVNPVYRSLEERLIIEEATLESLLERVGEIEKQAISYGQELERLSRLEPQLRSLERAVNIHEQNYRLYLTKFEESRVSDAMDAAKMVSVSILEPATTPLKPVPVNKALNILVSLVLGASAGLGLAFLMEYFDHTFKVPDDVEENLGVPLLAVIDDLPAKKKEDVASITARTELPLYCQILKSNVVIMAGEKGAKSLCICSPTQKEGASYVSLSLAASLAKDNGHSVLWIDGNLRQPYLNGLFNLPVSPGLVEIVQGGAGLEESLRTPVPKLPKLHVLSTGATPPTPSSVFESAHMAELIQSLKEKFDWIIFDCAPVDDYPDSNALSRRLDGVILVVQAENRNAEVAIQAKNNLERSGGTVLGAVLNRRRHVIPQAIYKKL